VGGTGSQREKKVCDVLWNEEIEVTEGLGSFLREYFRGGFEPAFVEGIFKTRS